MKVNAQSWQILQNDFLGNECTNEARDGDLQLAVNEQLVKLSKQLKLPLLFTEDSHFVRYEQKKYQDILLQNGNPDGWRFFTVYSQMNTEEAWNAWRYTHGSSDSMVNTFIEAVENNQVLVDRVGKIDFEVRYHIPEVDIPPSIQTLDLSYEQKLETYVLELVGEYGRMPQGNKEYEDRLRRELDVIARNGRLNFLSYFLMVHLFCRYAFENNIPIGPGRGSAAGCLLSYLLRITHLDPIRYGLSFERFLSLGRIKRGKFPDIDLDFGDVTPIVKMLEQKYGDRFARICTTGTLRVRGAIRDIGRILLDTKNNERAAKLVDDVSKSVALIPQGLDTKKFVYGYDDDDGVRHPGEIETNKLLADFLEGYPNVASALRELLDIPRNISRHASAYVISDVPVQDVVPMCRLKDEDGIYQSCTQLTMGPVEALGLIKFDLLGINTLKDISNTIKLVKERHGVTVDIYNMDVEDVDTFRAFCKGDNVTVFQFNGQIPVDLCRKLKPAKLEDLSDITAAGRPGTLYALMPDGKTTLVDEWVNRRKGSRINSIHPDMDDILKGTLGICIYQEQIMKLFEKCCGYSSEQADEIREIVGKKKREKMEGILKDIRQRLQDRGWQQAQIDSFVSLCVASASYSFNKSHSLSYAYVGYICQWLKVHYPLEWWMSILRNSSNEDLEKFSSHVAGMLLAPDINRSDLDYYVISDQLKKIMSPLNTIKGVKAAGKAIIEARAEKPFANLKDFYDRVPRRGVNLGVVKALIWAGAFDHMYKVAKPTDRILIYYDYLRLRGQEPEGKDLKMTEVDILMKQAHYLLTGFPDFLPFIKSMGEPLAVGPQHVLTMSEGYKGLKIGGKISDIREIKTKKGDPMAFVTIKNGCHEADVTVFPEAYRQHRQVLREGTILTITGDVGSYKGNRSLKANDLHVIYLWSDKEQDDGE